MALWEYLVTNESQTNILFSIMSCLGAMFEASSVYFQHVNKRAAHVKIDGVSRRGRPGP